MPVCSVNRQKQEKHHHLYYTFSSIVLPVHAATTYPLIPSDAFYQSWLLTHHGKGNIFTGPAHFFSSDNCVNNTNYCVVVLKCLALSTTLILAN